jgi:hypothetical protein
MRTLRMERVRCGLLAERMAGVNVGHGCAEAKGKRGKCLRARTYRGISILSPPESRVGPGAIRQSVFPRSGAFPAVGASLAPSARLR